MAHAALVTANNGSFLIKLVLNNSLVGFLDEYDHLYHSEILHILVMISDGCYDWNPAKHMAHVTNNFVTGV